MPEFQFLATLTVNAPSEAAAQTQADHAIEDTAQYLSEGYKLERSPEVSENRLLGLAKTAGRVVRAEQRLTRYSVELTTEGWQIKDWKRGVILGGAYGRRKQAEEGCEALNAVPKRDRRREL